jgi:hypothetical protein
MHEGVSRDGSHLFPAFPYDHFTKVSDDDVEALYAYLMTRPAVSAPALANTIPFPLNVGMLQEGKILFFRNGRYQPDHPRAPNGIAEAIWPKGSAIAAAHAAQLARR